MKLQYFDGTHLIRISIEAARTSIGGRVISGFEPVVEQDAFIECLEGAAAVTDPNAGQYDWIE